MDVDPRFLTAEGSEIFTGNELLLKGALEVEGGVHLLGGYPGSPIAGFFDAMSQMRNLLNDKGIRAVVNNNEALSAAMLNGSQVIGVRSMIVVKSVGVHVAADALALGNLAGAHRDGGAIIVYGDDPWSDSTQVPSDSRYISKHLFIPVIEPSNSREIKDFVDLSFKLSSRCELYAGFVLTNNLADGGGTVQCRPNQYPTLTTKQKTTIDTAAIDLNKFVLLPPKTWWQEESMPSRHRLAMVTATELGMNRIDHVPNERKAVGFITSGLAHGYLEQALWEMGLLGEFPILKYGLSYPVDPDLVRRLAQMCQRIVVVEERRGFMEEQISQIVLQDRQQGGLAAGVELWGKQFPDGLAGFPATRGLHPSIIIGRLVPLLKRIGEAPTRVAIPASHQALDREMETIDATAEREMPDLPQRLPTFCPGCPHRDSASLCLEIQKEFKDADYMRRTHEREAVDLVFHGDTGCYTMLMFPPNTTLMHDYSGMGLGGGTGSGTDPFIVNKEVVFMGDSTFFHSGQIAISQAIKLDQDITFIILDNKTTAMTGHQPTPGVEYDLMGNRTFTQDIEEIVRGMATDGSAEIIRTNPEDRPRYRKLLEKTFLDDGVKVIIADKECAITRTRRRRRTERAIIHEKGFLPSSEHMNINPEICRFCLACAEMTGCAGLRHVETDYGRKMDTDVTWCVNDGACERIGACWSFERVTVKRKRRPRSRVPELGLDDIPEPQKRPTSDLWYAYLTGVGCMGVGLVTNILVRAGAKEGYRVTFIDKKGMAIRNGGVSSQVAFTRGDQPITGMVPYGKADLIIGLDILEAARAMDPRGRTRIASADRTAAVVNSDKFTTIRGLMGWDNYDVDQIETMIRRHTRGDDFLVRNISRICEKYLGSKIYANIMMLGFAFQKGLIPVSMHSIAWAIRDALRADHRKNLYAFNMGRKFVEDPNLFLGPPQRTGWRETLDQRCRHVIRRHLRGQKKADQLAQLAVNTIEPMAGLSESLRRDIVVRMYDCMRWGGLGYAERYANAVAGVYAKDSPEHDYAATRAVVHNLAQAMLIKDAVYIAELSTSPEKYARDREKYNVNTANGDRIVYKHLLPATLRIGPWAKRVELSCHDKTFRMLRSMRWLRKVLPGWHRGEKTLLAHYSDRVAQFDWSTTEDYLRALTVLSSASCMDCMNPRCIEAGCPLKNRIPEWIELANSGQWKAASNLLHQTNNFPEFTASVCPAPCQSACKLSLNGYPVQIREIERQIVERAFAGGWVTPRLPERKTSRRVAVIGSGPAGLTAAQQLARAGHDVTVFEKDKLPGGLLRWGIPEPRLDKSLVDRRVEQLRAEGVTFESGVHVGRDSPADRLLSDFDAVCLALGATKPRDLNVPGRQSEGVHFALDFLRSQLEQSTDSPSGQPRIDARGKAVVVIGGGETGNDCCEVAMAQGAREIHQFEILPESTINGDPTHPEPAGINKRWCVATKRFLGNRSGLGGLSAVSAMKVRWILSTNGPKMLEVPGTDFDVKADLALLALGYETLVEPDLVAQLGLAIDGNGKPVVQNFETSVPGVFVAGDLATGASLVAKAIDTGRKAAERIEKYLAMI